MSHLAELYRFHTAFVLVFLAFVVVFAIAHWGGRGTGIGGRE
jgi:hypothetical protein